MISQKLPIGILGDGQLALMLGEAALAQGVDFRAYGNDPESSFATRFPDHFVKGQMTDERALNEFARSCSALTLENEFFKAEALKKISRTTGVPIFPDPASYQFFEGKISQRRFYERLAIPSPRWIPYSPSILDQFSFPFVLKTSEGGYDGYGVRMVERKEDLAQALDDLGYHQGRAILLEEKVKIEREFAQGVLLDGKGHAMFLPLVETVQRNGICEMVLSRPALPTKELKKIETAILIILKKFASTALRGLFNFEFFLANGEVLINEGAPRTHNSQHLTMDASSVSQFSMVMNYLWTGSMDPKVITALPAVMVNLLGKSKGEKYELKLPPLPSEVKVHPKLYLKKECRPGRKMGHLNLVDPSGKINLTELARRVLREYEL